MKQVDVLIIGAGLSGIGSACHLAKRCSDKSYLILEGREALGGTWDVFRYPGVRSDSDMFSLGYNFKPWTSFDLLADGPSILSYIQEAAKENNVLKNIQYNAQVEKIAWDTESSTWTVFYVDKLLKKERQLSCSFIESCTGYYNYEHGYQPQFKGRENYKGTFIHPQFWPEDLDYSGKKVVVIGSGATAVTIVPEIAKKAKQLTMLQRSPSYMAELPAVDKFSKTIKKYLPEKVAYRISRTWRITLMYTFYVLSRLFPNMIRNLLLLGVKKQVGESNMEHFKPNYKPWDQRLCAVKDGDLFKGIRKETINIVTDEIDRLSESGIILKSGGEIEADIIVSATGLDLKFMGGIKVEVDGKYFDCSEKMNYKGVMLEGLPNLGFTFGYTNASWTLKADLTAEWICRLISLMDKKGTKKVVPINKDKSMQLNNLLEFKSGYVQRAKNNFPKTGDKYPWKLIQSYPIDAVLLRLGKMDDGVLQFLKS